ncbi:tetratricopeptide (TPR) repeat protein [Cerasibacillus quisquiliarum]|uniref:Uncharacterized protein n=1 Tax=Cerasibacillus quisquiliarum TaxID=227865 RepID=A0A511UY61_9BACI|nr:tetratricopeptide repeat protein [Cerasibacillus quisquiliarum]MBB5146767.1 tetratricopeptide (TPR) repeat protein [Cerasibacillus quisquiliarum]GEN31567.1 hypothetical protein CQU01_18050 [Cerasibacillus quisquiliarum]
MNFSDIPFNMKFHFDDDLREVPISKGDMIKGINFIKESLSYVQTEGEKAKLYGLIGVYSRIVQQLDESKRYLDLAVKINESHQNDRARFVNELRLAHTHQWMKNFTVSNKIFNRLVNQALENDNYKTTYLDFVYQHAGKNFFDQGKYHSALTYFEEALEIRMRKDNQELIDSTTYAIRVCEKRMVCDGSSVNHG